MDVVGIRVVKFVLFPNWGSIDTNWSKTGCAIACCLNADAAVGLNVDQRAGWERTEHGLLTNLMQILHPVEWQYQSQLWGEPSE